MLGLELLGLGLTMLGLELLGLGRAVTGREGACSLAVFVVILQSAV